MVKRDGPENHGVRARGEGEGQHREQKPRADGLSVSVHRDGEDAGEHQAVLLPDLVDTDVDVQPRATLRICSPIK